MKRVVLIGFDPTALDLSDPALPPGMTAEKIHAGIKLALTDFAGAGLASRELLHQTRRDCCPDH